MIIIKTNYKTTVYACFIGYIIQAIVNNFAPLLFITFQTSYEIPLSEITLLVTFNFAIQLIVDLVSVKYIDKLGYKASVFIAHVFSAVGLLSLAILPQLFPDPFYGLLLAVTLYAIGGGLLEVLVSPIVESCPTDNKEAAMSLLHSFYCWGYVGVVLISTAYFAIFGISNWQYLCVLWALFALANGILFLHVPFAKLVEDGEEGISVRSLFKNKFFWLFVVMITMAGASEQSVAQWSSTFAEQNLRISKDYSDLVGPMFFALMMGLSRAIYGKYGHRINLTKFMVSCTCLCVISYVIIFVSSKPAMGILACGLSGFSVGIMWPGTFSKCASVLRKGGTAMFAFLALAGDLGCSAGPTFVGFVSSAFDENLKIGLSCAVIFPLALIGCIMLEKSFKKATN